jgi:hypothetical protein
MYFNMLSKKQGKVRANAEQAKPQRPKKLRIKELPKLRHAPHGQDL